MNTYFISINNGRHLVTKVNRSRRSQKLIDFQTSRDPQWAIRIEKAQAELIAKEVGGVAEPIANISRFYR